MSGGGEGLFAHRAVDELAHDVEVPDVQVPDVAGVLLEQVQQHAADSPCASAPLTGRWPRTRPELPVTVQRR